VEGSKEIFEKGPLTCLGCGLAIATRMITRNIRKKPIIVLATGCLEVTTTQYPYTHFNCPVIHGAFENAPAIASGVYRALKAQGLERDIDIIVLAGDGATFDIGFQSLSGMFERGEEVCYICLDNEAYMNTGIQRSGATPLYALTTTTPSDTVMRGKMEERKQVALIFGMHNVRYVATATLGYHVDFISKVKKALQMKPSFLHVLTPCPTGWGFDSEDTIKISKLAVETCFFPLFEIEDGYLKLTQKITKKTPVRDFLKLQKRFSHLSDEEIDKIQELVDRNYNYLLELEKAGKVFYQFS